MVVQVVKGVMYLLEDDSQVGTMLFIHVTGRAYEFTHSKASMRPVSLTPRGDFACQGCISLPIAEFKVTAFRQSTAWRDIGWYMRIKIEPGIGLPKINQKGGWDDQGGTSGPDGLRD